MFRKITLIALLLMGSYGLNAMGIPQQRRLQTQVLSPNQRLHRLCGVIERGGTDYAAYSQWFTKREWGSRDNYSNNLLMQLLRMLAKCDGQRFDRMEQFVLFVLAHHDMVQETSFWSANCSGEDIIMLASIRGFSNITQALMNQKIARLGTDDNIRDYLSNKNYRTSETIFDAASNHFYDETVGVSDTLKRQRPLLGAYLRELYQRYGLLSADEGQPTEAAATEAGVMAYDGATVLAGPATAGTVQDDNLMRAPLSREHQFFAYTLPYDQRSSTVVYLTYAGEVYTMDHHGQVAIRQDMMATYDTDKDCWVIVNPGRTNQHIVPVRLYGQDL